MSRQGPITKDTSSVALGLAQIRVGDSAANIGTIAPVLTSADSIGALANTKFSGNVDYWKLESGFPLQEDITIPLRETIMLECGFKEISPYNLALARGIDVGAATQAATISPGTIVSTLGTTTQTAAGETPATDLSLLSDYSATVTETMTVVFTTATAFSVYGSVSGHLGDAANLTSAFDVTNAFRIPADFFSGTWAADDTYTFSTTAYVASGAYDNAHSGFIPLGTIVAPAYVRMEAVYTFPNGINTMTVVMPRANVVSSIDLDLQAEEAANVVINFESKNASSDVSGGNAVWNNMSLGQIVFG